ncbi:MAG: ABC transporter ATP-binding protein [Coriobacteriales bacterium]|jgi:ABC-2 type transport system ATP-binding protein|nr:ABC transporter ATP-binding protein [Coriobacteriales bacterium]
MKIRFDDVSLRYGMFGRGVSALHRINLEIPDGRVCGLLGRNGAGKSSLLSLIAGLRRPSGGRVRVDGEIPFENRRIMSEVSYIGSHFSDRWSYLSARDLLRLAGAVRPDWDQVYADELIDLFQVPRRRRLSSYSTGQRAAFYFVLGFAGRSPITILDEVGLGMDAVLRERLIQEILRDLAAHPRTLIISTHYISEAERLFDQVVILDRGQIALCEEADDLRAEHGSINDAFIKLTKGSRVLKEASDE